MTRPDRRDRVPLDWTTDPVTKYSNSSAEYKRLVKEVERLIRDSAHSLINGDVSCVAALIVSQLAHVHGLRPNDACATGDCDLAAVTRERDEALRERNEALRERNEARAAIQGVPVHDVSNTARFW